MTTEIMIIRNKTYIVKKTLAGFFFFVCLFCGGVGGGGGEVEPIMQEDILPQFPAPQ
jgi:hypothetical protein